MSQKERLTRTAGHLERIQRMREAHRDRSIGSYTEAFLIHRAISELETAVGFTDEDQRATR